MFDVNQIIPKSKTRQVLFFKFNSKLQMTEITGICVIVLFLIYSEDWKQSDIVFLFYNCCTFNIQ